MGISTGEFHTPPTLAEVSWTHGRRIATFVDRPGHPTRDNDAPNRRRSPPQLIDRLPPQSLEAEQSVLGAILIDHDAVIEVAEILRPEDFYRQAARADLSRR